MACPSDVTDGTPVFRPYLSSRSPHPVPGGLGGKEGRGLWCVSAGTEPRSDEAEAEAENKERKWPPPWPPWVYCRGSEGGGSSRRIQPQAREVPA